MKKHSETNEEVKILKLNLSEEEESRALYYAHEQNVEVIYDIVKHFQPGQEQEEVVAQFFPDRIVNTEQNDYFKLVMSEICEKNAEHNLKLVSNEVQM